MKPGKGVVLGGTPLQVAANLNFPRRRRRISRDADERRPPRPVVRRLAAARSCGAAGCCAALGAETPLLLSGVAGRREELAHCGVPVASELHARIRGAGDGNASVQRGGGLRAAAGAVVGGEHAAGGRPRRGRAPPLEALGGSGRPEGLAVDLGPLQGASRAGPHMAHSHTVHLAQGCTADSVRRVWHRSLSTRSSSSRCA